MQVWARTAAFAAMTVMGAGVLAGCGGDDDSPAQQPVAVSHEAPTGEVVAPEAEGDDAAEETSSPGGGIAERYASSFAGRMDPEPTWVVGDLLLTFTFPSGSVDVDPELHCAIASGAFSGDLAEWESQMTYPDGSVLCSEVLG